ncbi:MAG: hypothetical protein M0P75_00020 [Candidatus Marinimicrobia bacterium]|nr:hypothetical protein [Candidatus Neomarinimicrobiota bacterium]
MNYYLEEKQQLWRLLIMLGCIRPLSVYAASPTTFNVVAGRYEYDGEIKTYTQGDAVNPTDNDTTYVWLNDDNSIASGIDGDGWPATEHIKLAEIDVDADGVITDIRDMRTVQLTITPAA